MVMTQPFSIAFNFNKLADNVFRLGGERKTRENLVKARSGFDRQIERQIWV